MLCGSGMCHLPTIPPASESVVESGRASMLGRRGTQETYPASVWVRHRAFGAVLAAISTDSTMEVSKEMSGRSREYEVLST